MSYHISKHLEASSVQRVSFSPLSSRMEMWYNTVSRVWRITSSGPRINELKQHIYFDSIRSRLSIDLFAWISQFSKLSAVAISFIWSWCSFSFLPEASKPPVSILFIRRRQQVLHSWSVHWPSDSKCHFGLWEGKIQFNFQGNIDVLILCRTVNNLIISDYVPSVRYLCMFRNNKNEKLSYNFSSWLNLHETNDKTSSYISVRTIASSDQDMHTTKLLANMLIMINRRSKTWSNNYEERPYEL